MKVIILAAGVGSRLNPITNLKPKAMVKVNGKPLIQHQIDAYISAGITEKNIYVAGGYLAEQLKSFLDKNYPSVNFVNNSEYATTNNMYSLSLLLNNRDIVGDDIFINNADCVYDFDIIKDMYNSSAEDLVACDPSVYQEESMKITVTNDHIDSISKQTTADHAYAVSIDLYKFSAKGAEKLCEIVNKWLKKDKNKWTEVAINELFAQHIVKPFDIMKRKWIEIDNFDDLLIADQLFSKFSMNKKKALVLDLDGTVYLGENSIKPAVDFINSVSGRYDIYFMTNNTSRAKKDYVKKLKKVGVKEVFVDNIITPLEVLVEYLQKNGINRVYGIINDTFKKELQSRGVICCNSNRLDQSQAVIVGYDTELTYEKIKTAALLLQNRQLPLLATHSDTVCPTPEGFIPDAGAILQLLKSSVDIDPTKIFGKPNPALLEPLFKKYQKEEMVIVGDRLYTDKILAENSGIDFVLVLSGETNRSQIEQESVFPCLIAHNLSAISKYI